ncbi:MAG: PD-(D/E)XK nuclease family protein [Cyclobacteriaceae bacterium]|nr:PD-(D/E)XK nuclease family protein [Cyclobacteriaceae bacterium]
MKNGFLHTIATELLDQHGMDMSHLHIVFPNRRAGLFFNKYLSEIAQKPLWSPNIYGISDYITRYSPYEKADKLQLIFELYGVFTAALNSSEKAEHFFFWGETLLGDFDEMDKYLADVKRLFSNLLEQKELERPEDYLTEEQKQHILTFWKAFGAKLSTHQKNYLRLWEKLYGIYADFNKNLDDLRLGYEGKIYRYVAENPQFMLEKTENQDIVFAGFNALSNSEIQIISQLVEAGRARIYWDADEYYTSDALNEAGQFIRAMRKHPVLSRTFPETWNNNFQNKEKKITFVGAPLNIGQAQAMAMMLEKNNVEEPISLNEETAIVLADEQLLFPVLNALPQELERLNITMGYPVSASLTHSFVNIITDLQLFTRSRSDGEVWFNHRHLIPLLRHPFVQKFEYEFIEELCERLIERNRVYISSDELDLSHPFFLDLMHKAEDGKALIQYLQTLLSHFSEENTGSVEWEFIGHYQKILTRLGDLFVAYQMDTDLYAFVRLFRQIVLSLRLPFEGEPLEGLQVMGMLETRNIDFKNVFILSMNDGVFPAKPQQNSFIPLNLRRGFGLPTFETRDAIFSYLFYRLLQRAERVFLLYNTEDFEGHRGEVSRFLLQLQFESGLNIEHKLLQSPVTISQPRTISIVKTDEILKHLMNYCREGTEKPASFTPSAINTYLECRLRFYFRYVLKLDEEKEIEENIGMKELGNLFHLAAEFLYADFLDKNHTIESKDVNELQKKVSGSIEKAYRKQYSMQEHEIIESEGQWVLIREILKKMLLKVLEIDRKYAPFNIQGLEAGQNQGYSTLISVETDLKTYMVSLKGVIDRIDEKDQVLRLADYKTGRDKSNFKSMDSLFDREDKNRNKAVLQLFFYALLADKSGKWKNKFLQPALFNLSELFGDHFDWKLEMKEPYAKNSEIITDARPYLEEFENLLSQVLVEIYDPNVNFNPTEDLDKCRYCSYAAICNR